MEGSDFDLSKAKPDLLDVFHPGKKVCKVPRMSRKYKIDPFDELRPNPGEYLEYTISQTDTKLDAGVTKIHMCQTRATYIDWPEEDKPPPPPPPPPPKKKKKIKYTHGCGPCWEFLDEIWARKQEALQKIYKKEAKIRQRRVKEQERRERQYFHDILMTLVGPDWYQELSAKQISAVDDLKRCIIQDFQNNTLTNVKENLATLGLMLRPNTKNVETALKYCCECPVEFLLILYQVMNPKRTAYSLNDRLLLSAVVHLTMKDTLRELHIRIPSPPPRKKKKPHKPTPAPAKDKYKSPYLEPYTIKAKVESDGLYKNTSRQYPESIYFSYIDDLRVQTEDYSSMIEALSQSLRGGLPEDQPLSVEEDLVSEWQRAQESYERLNVDHSLPTPILHRANVYPKCNHGMDEPDGEGEIEEEIQQISNLAQIDELVETEINKTDMTIAIELKITSDYDDKSELTQQRFEYYVDIDEAIQPTYLDSIEHSQKMFHDTKETFLTTGVCIGRDGKPVYCLAGVVDTFWMPPDEATYRKHIEDAQAMLGALEHTFVLGGVAISKDGEPVYVINGTLPTSHYDEYIYNAQEILTYNENTFLLGSVVIDREGNPTYHIQNVSGSKMCKCELLMARQAAEARMAAEQEYMTMLQFKKELQRREEWERNCRRKLLELEEEAYHKMRVTKSSEEQLVSVRRRSSPCCECRRAVENFVNLPRCTCERCQADLKEKRKIFIIEGTSVRTGDPIHIITGTAEEKDCKCLERYQKKMAEFEDRKARQEAYLNLKSLNKKYIINGLTRGPDGEPIYILSGLVPKRECPCAENDRLEKLRVKNMPQKLPPDKRYIISGIQATPNGNIYIVSGVNPFPDCKCMEVYNSFVAKHRTCMELYDAFVRKMEKDLQEYMSELAEEGYEQEIQEGSESESHEVETQKERVAYGSATKGGPKKTLIYDITMPNLVVEVDKDHCVDTKNSKIVQYDPDHPRFLDVKLENQNDYKPFHKGNVEYDPGKPHFVLLSQSKERLSERNYIDPVEEQEIILDLQIKRKKRVCLCHKKNDNDEEEDCKCAEKIKQAPPPPPREYKRYILQEKIPCSYELQMLVLKQVLTTMAEDGFPLAKLPDCYLLPHFKLWWRWRCGIYISQDDRRELLKFSKKFWTHTDRCHRNVRLPRVPISKDEAGTYTWQNAHSIRKLTNGLNNNHHRTVKGAHVEDGREYFPTMCDYDLPTNKFKECYFAYIPWKEEESFAAYPWFIHEFKKMDTKRCCK